MARPIFVPRYEESENTILTRMLSKISDEWRKEPGDFIHDAIAAAPLEIKQAQINLDNTLRQSVPQYAEGEDLDAHLNDVGLTRAPATPNKRNLSITADAGVVLPAGYKLSTVILDGKSNPLEFTIDEAKTYTTAGALTVAVTCTTAGQISNAPNGTSFILSPPLPGIRSITDLGTTIKGTDTEDDESAWNRYDFKVTHPDTGGNKSDYIRWAQDITGVGKAKCIPRWSGNGTVKVVLLDTDYAPASDTIVNAAQEYLDPGITGLGDGKAPCGAFVTVVKATNVPINITATVTWSEGADQVTSKTAFQNDVVSYLKSLAFTEYPNVIYNKIAAFLSFTDGVSNFTELTINGGTVDIAVGSEAVATIGTVTL